MSELLRELLRILHATTSATNLIGRDESGDPTSTTTSESPFCSFFPPILSDCSRSQLLEVAGETSKRRNE